MKIKKAIVLMLAVILMLTYGFPSAADELTDAQKAKKDRLKNILEGNSGGIDFDFDLGDLGDYFKSKEM